VGIVAASFPLEINRWIARIIILALVHLDRVTSILAHKTLHRRPGLDQRPVRAEVVIARPARLAALIVNRPEEQDRHFPGEHPFRVLRKHRVVPASLLHIPIQKPYPQKVPLQLVTEPPLAPHAVQRHQYPRLQELLGRNRGPAKIRIQLLKERTQAPKRLIAELLDHTQGGALQESSLQGSTPSNIAAAKQVVLSCSTLYHKTEVKFFMNFFQQPVRKADSINAEVVCELLEKISATYPGEGLRR
jgi:hypothetical protein